MTEYLLDTSVASSLFDASREKEHKLVKERFCQILKEGDRIYVCPIVIGEIEYGFKVDQNEDDPRRKAIRGKLEDIPVLNMDKHTANCYSDIRAELFRKCAPKEERKNRRDCIKKGIAVENLIDSTSGKKMGIQENDLWIIACALTRNMTLVTSDQMKRLRQIIFKEMKLTMGWEYIPKQQAEETR